MIQSKSIENSVILITGGTGSFGSTLTELLLKIMLKKYVYLVEMKTNNI